METRTAGFRAVEEFLQAVGRSGRQVMQDHQAPGLREALPQGAVDPSVGIHPVERDRIPQHAAEAISAEIVDDGRLQQAVVEIAAAAERAEPTVGMREIADQALRAADLAL